MKVLCFGSLNIDYTYDVEHFVGAGETLSSSALQVFSGGKGLNQSIALARAGAEVFLAGAVGRDGAFLLDTAAAAGVDVSLVRISDDVRTGHAIIQRDSSGGNCILLYGGANRSITKELIDDVLSHFDAGDWLVLQNEINALDCLIDAANARGLQIVLNPSPMNETVSALPLEKIDLFLLNEVEAAQLLGRELGDAPDGAAVMNALRGRFPSAAIVLTLGEHGSWYADADKLVYQPSIRVAAVDTTAAGDTYEGFFLASRLRGEDVQRSMLLAAKAAAIAVTRCGAAPSIPTRAEVEV